MQHQSRTPLSLVVAPSSSQQQSPSTAPLSPSSSSIYSNDSSSAESPLVLTPRSQPPILSASPPKLDLGLSYCNYHNQQQTHIANHNHRATAGPWEKKERMKVHHNVILHITTHTHTYLLFPKHPPNLAKCIWFPFISHIHTCTLCISLSLSWQTTQKQKKHFIYTPSTSSPTPLSLYSSSFSFLFT